MEEIVTTDQNNIEPVKVCIQCSNADILQGYPNALCKSCRESFIKYPIPLWVKIFGGVVLVLLLIAMFEIPGNFAIGLALARGENAEKQRNYLTEQQELEKIVYKVPNSLDISGHLIVPAFYNNDFITFTKAAGNLSNKTFDDTAFINRLNVLQNTVSTYFANDSLSIFTKKYPKGVLGVPNAELKKYVGKFPNDVFATYNYAARFFDIDGNKKCDSLLSTALAIDPDYVYALQTKTVVKREINQLDSSIIYCDKLLALNHQSIFGLSSKARTILKQGDRVTGLQLALKAYSLDKTDPYNLATMALAYHLSGRTSDRDKLIKAAARDTVAMGYMQYIKDIVNGKTKFN